MTTTEKNILVLSSWYPNRLHPYLGNFVQRQAQLIAKTHNITVVHVVADSTIENEEINTTQSVNFTEVIGYYPDHKFKLIRFWREFVLFKKLLLQINTPDLIHAHVCLPKGYLFLRAKHYFRRPLIVTEHGSYFEPTKQSTWGIFKHVLMRNLIKHTTKFIAVSEVLKSDMQRLISSTIEVIPNPIDTQLFYPTKEKSGGIRFLHVSTLDDSTKNISGLLEAFHQFSLAGHSTAELTIISEEPFAHWEQLCREKYANARIKFIGPLTEKEIVSHFQQCSAVVLNSRYETFSIVLAEAFSCGKPVISTPVGIARNLPPELGFSTVIDDISSVVKAMEKFDKQKDLFNPERIRTHALQLDSVDVMNQLNELYVRFSQ